METSSLYYYFLFQGPVKNVLPSLSDHDVSSLLSSSDVTWCLIIRLWVIFCSGRLLNINSEVWMRDVPPKIDVDDISYRETTTVRNMKISTFYLCLSKF